MSDEIINKVADANIEQIDLKVFLPKEAVIEIDLRSQLWNELVLREKEFRLWIKQVDWATYKNKIVALYCSADAIIPAWAYMLVTAELNDAKAVFFGSPDVVKEDYFFENLNNWKVDNFSGKRVMVKGCSEIPNPEKAYVILTKKLVPVVKSLMFGEPCSAVPVFKKR